MQPENLTRTGCYTIFYSGNTIGVIIMLTQESVLQAFEYVDGSLYHKEDKANQISKGDLAGGVGSHGYM